MKQKQLIAYLITLLFICVLPAAAHEKTTNAFIEAFKEADTAKMSEHFAENVEFLGEHKFINLADRMLKPKSISKQHLAQSYDLLFAKLGKEAWKNVTVKIKPSVEVSEEGKELRGFIKKGDIICDMCFREAKKGKRKGFDEAVIFVFRKVGKSYKIVFHIADF